MRHGRSLGKVGDSDIAKSTEGLNLTSTGMIIGTAAWAIALIVIEHVDRGALVDGVLSPLSWDGTIARPPHRPRAAPAGGLRLSRQDRVAAG